MVQFRSFVKLEDCTILYLMLTMTKREQGLKGWNQMDSTLKQLTLLASIMLLIGLYRLGMMERSGLTHCASALWNKTGPGIGQHSNTWSCITQHASTEHHKRGAEYMFISASCKVQQSFLLSLYKFLFSG
uniref:Uncharacterized protein n=1 Tax=Opuntia streptacantha TaxID=393608 RepID=A0A7C9EBB8_OPUST